MSNSSYFLKISPGRYCGWLLVVAIGFVITHLGFNYYNHRVEETEWLIHQLFELDEENNLPTWFSGFLLLNNAFILFVMGNAQEDKYRIHWLVLALGFLILSIDEVAGLHESFNTAIDFNWAIVGGVIVVLAGLSFIPFLLSLERRLALLFVLSGFIFVSGAIGIELLSEDMDEDEIEYGFATALEEGLEMLGALLFLYVNLKNMQKQGQVKILLTT